MKGFDTVLFGRYPQTSDGGIRSIEWLVLKEQGRKILALSRYGLDCRPYHGVHEPVTWETCDLRKWLNTEFLRTAFTEEEQRQIRMTPVYMHQNPNCGTDPGKMTKDRVFLLSFTEAENYFWFNRERANRATDYCRSRGADRDRDGRCTWWLRSPGFVPESAACVKGDGSIYEGGHRVTCSSYAAFGRCAVRPALWIDPDS